MLGNHRVSWLKFVELSRQPMEMPYTAHVAFNPPQRPSHKRLSLTMRIRWKIKFAVNWFMASTFCRCHDKQMTIYLQTFCSNYFVIIWMKAKQNIIQFLYQEKVVRSWNKHRNRCPPYGGTVSRRIDVICWWLYSIFVMCMYMYIDAWLILCD